MVMAEFEQKVLSRPEPPAPHTAARIYPASKDYSRDSPPEWLRC